MLISFDNSSTFYHQGNLCIWSILCSPCCSRHNNSSICRFSCSSCRPCSCHCMGNIRPPLDNNSPLHTFYILCNPCICHNSNNTCLLFYSMSIRRNHHNSHNMLISFDNSSTFYHQGNLCIWSILCSPCRSLHNNSNIFLSSCNSCRHCSCHCMSNIDLPLDNKSPLHTFYILCNHHSSHNIL